MIKKSRPFAEVKASPSEKNKKLLSFFGVWKGTKLDNDKLWKEVLKRKSRKELIKL